MVARAKEMVAFSRKNGCRRKDFQCNHWHEKCNFFRETLRYKDFGVRPAVQNGSGAYAQSVRGEPPAQREPLYINDFGHKKSFGYIVSK